MGVLLLTVTCLVVVAAANKPSKLESLYDSSDPNLPWPPEANKNTSLRFLYL